jgi:hypothetical protein
VGVRILTRRGLGQKPLAQPGPGARAEGEERRLLYGARFEHHAKPTKPFVGTVREKGTGKPLAGIRVGTVPQYGKAYYPVEAVTDAKGHYRLVGWPKASAYHLIAAQQGDRGYLSEVHGVGDSVGLAPITVDFELSPGVVIEGHLRDKEGRPVPAADVTYRPLAENKHLGQLADPGYWARARVHDGGRFRLVALPGPGVLLATTRDGRFRPARIDPADRENGYTAATLRLEGAHAYRRINPEPAARTLAADLTVVAGKVRAVTLVGPDGKPLPGCTVQGARGDGGQAQALAGATLTAVGLDPGRPWQLTAWHTGKKLAGQVTLRGDEAEPITLKLVPWGSVTGRVLDSDGKPLTAAGIEVFHRLGRADVTLARRPTHENLTTDREGRFRVDALVPGLKYALRVAKGGLPATRVKRFESVTVEAGKTADLGEATAKQPGDQ